MAEEKKAKQADELKHNDQEQEQVEEEKWLKYYSSLHEILLVGEGDFSFSTCLAKSFGSASNIVASSCHSYDEVIKNFKNAESNLSILDKLGASHLHQVDAKKMKFHSNLSMRKFDRIIFNFPHAGFHGKEDNRLLIEMHRSLLNGFFKNASGMLRPNGEIHVNHKTSIPYCHWNLEELASHNSLRLIECVAFKKEDYPGYENKRGSGSKCDEPFLLGKCCTFKFCFSPNAKVTKVTQNMKKPQKPAKSPNSVSWQPKSFEFRHPPSDLVTYMSGTPALNISLGRSLEPFQTLVRSSQRGNILEHGQPREILQAPQQGNYLVNRHPPSDLVTNTELLQILNVLLPLIHASQRGNMYVHGQPHEFFQAPVCANQQRNYLPSRHPPSDLNLQMRGTPGCNGPRHIDHIFLKCKSIFGGYFEGVVNALGSPDYKSSYFLQEALQLGYKRYIAGDPSGSPSNYAYIVEQFHKYIVGRQAWQMSGQVTVENNFASKSRIGPFK